MGSGEVARNNRIRIKKLEEHIIMLTEMVRTLTEIVHIAPPIVFGKELEGDDFAEMIFKAKKDKQKAVWALWNNQGLKNANYKSSFQARPLKVRGRQIHGK